jgi:hypothetical protein
MMPITSSLSFTSQRHVCVTNDGVFVKGKLKVYDERVHGPFDNDIRVIAHSAEWNTITTIGATDV